MKKGGKRFEVRYMESKIPSMNKLLISSRSLVNFRLLATRTRSGSTDRVCEFYLLHALACGFQLIPVPFAEKRM